MATDFLAELTATVAVADPGDDGKREEHVSAKAGHAVEADNGDVKAAKCKDVSEGPTKEHKLQLKERGKGTGVKAAEDERPAQLEAEEAVLQEAVDAGWQDKLLAVALRDKAGLAKVTAYVDKLVLEQPASDAIRRFLLMAKEIHADGGDGDTSPVQQRPG